MLAYSSDAEREARRISADLEALGFTVGPAPPGPGRQAAGIERADRVLMLWSRAARGTPALRAAARRAKAKGKLVCVSLDAAPPPTGGNAVRPPRQRLGWRPLLAPPRAKPAAQVPPVRRRSSYVATGRAQRDRKQVVIRTAPRPLPKPPRKGAGPMALAAVVVLIATAAGVETYARDPAFATQVNSMSASARQQAEALVSRLVPR
ncbi:MAG: hypothetical protein R3C16_03470 [Hyphomonadaceae bacterium]